MLFCPNYSIIIWKQTSFMMHWIIIGLSKRFNIKSVICMIRYITDFKLTTSEKRQLYEKVSQILKLSKL